MSLQDLSDEQQQQQRQQRQQRQQPVVLAPRLSGSERAAPVKKAKVEPEVETPDSGVSSDEEFDVENDDATLSNEFKDIRRHVHDGQDRSFARIAKDIGNDWTAAKVRQYYDEGCQQAEERRTHHASNLRRYARIAPQTNSKVAIKAAKRHYLSAKARLARHVTRTAAALARNE